MENAIEVHELVEPCPMCHGKVIWCEVDLQYYHTSKEHQCEGSFIVARLVERHSCP